MFQAWDAFEQTVDGFKGLSRGKLRISVVSTAKYFMPRLIASFCEKFPDIDVALEILNRDGVYADNRVMKRVGGATAGETFWCHVTGRAIDRAAPHAAGIWTFEDLSAQRPVTAPLTPREREVAAQLIQGLTAKAIGRVLGISHRTVEIYRARLMRKYKASTTAVLVQRLMGGL
jgi:DNA-binding CsgD family transcriptional regulator